MNSKKEIANTTAIKIARSKLNDYPELKRYIKFTSSREDIDDEIFIIWSFKDGTVTYEKMEDLQNSLNNFLVDIQKALKPKGIKVEISGTRNGIIYAISENALISLLNLELK